MAQLVVTSQGLENQVVNLKLGVTRIGRHADCDCPIDHPTISAVHCEIALEEECLILRDCGSTNGTYVEDKRVERARLVVGDSFRLGEVCFRVVSTDVTIAIPQFEMPRPAPPVVRADGSMLCPRHPATRVTHQCTHCKEVMCDQCVHYLRRRGGKVLKLCPLCSHPCRPIGEEQKAKKSLFGFLKKTVKLPFSRKRGSGRGK